MPFGSLLRMLFFDASLLVRNAAKANVMRNHKANLKQLFYLVENFPQLSLPFTIGEIDPKDLIDDKPKVLKKAKKGYKHKNIDWRLPVIDPNDCGIIYPDDDGLPF